MPPSRLSAVAVAALVLAVSPAARAEDPPAMSDAARALWDEGHALYQAGDYPAAIERFQRGRAIEPRPEFLYALGQAERKRGNCRAAIEHYRAFIVESRSDRQVEAARVQISRCEGELASEARPAPPPPAAPVAAQPAPPRRDDGRQRWKDGLGLSLAVAGLAAGGGAIVFAVRSRSELDAEASYGGWEDQLAVRRRDRALAIGLGAAGGGLLAAALVRFWWVGRGAGGGARAVLVPLDGGGLVAVEGRLP